LKWAEIDLDAALWTIPAAKMKRSVHGKVNGRPHQVGAAGAAGRHELSKLHRERSLSG
jgi:hypothetical protein